MKYIISICMLFMVSTLSAQVQPITTREHYVEKSFAPEKWTEQILFHFREKVITVIHGNGQGPIETYSVKNKVIYPDQVVYLTYNNVVFIQRYNEIIEINNDVFKTHLIYRTTGY